MYRHPFFRTLMFVVLCMAGVWSVAAMPIVPAPPSLTAVGYLLIDADSGRYLVAHNIDQRLPPASLTKIMTSYVVASELERGTIAADDEVPVSIKAWRMEGSRMFIREGTQVSVEDLLRGVIVQSGNDATVALAEHVAGSEDAFADIMNQQAERLGMSNSRFMNASGLPDDDHYVTARDLATLTVALVRDYPEHYKIYSEKSFEYNDIRQPNRNRLLWRDDSVDGVKTGYTEAAGYCLVASARRDGMRLISVVMGAGSEEVRTRESQALLAYGFRNYRTHRVYEEGKSLRRVRVFGGAVRAVELGPAEPLVVTVPRGSRDSLQAALDFPVLIRAPLQQGQIVGSLTLSLDGEVVDEVPLQALAEVAEAGFLAAWIDSVVLFFLQLFGMDTSSV